jgi:hypothetical protein
MSKAKAGLHKLTVKGLDGKKEIERELHIIKCKGDEELSPPVNIELTTDKPSYKNGDIITITARLTDRKGSPLGNHAIEYGVFNCVSYYNRLWKGRTDKNGVVSKTIPALGMLSKWHYVYWAGVETEEYGYKKREGNIGYAETDFGVNFPTKWFTAKPAEGIKIDGKMESNWLMTDKVEISADTNFLEANIEDYEDLSAEVRVLWEEDNIYLLADIKDDIPMKNNKKKIDLWNGDCIELFISVDPDSIPERGYSGSDFQILIGANDKMWIAGQVTGGVRNNVPLKSKTVTKKTKTGYILETKINVVNFYDKSHKFFKKGDVLGFDVAIGDADATMEREGKLIWNGVETGYKDSAVWGRLKLE